MSTQTSTLGTCPHCGTELSKHAALIEYERGGERAIYAECPGCERVVHPA